MSRKILLQLVVILSLLVPSFVLAQTNEIKNYTVKKGDTLWSISRDELGDAFLWPKVWKENPEIANPDRLYPGQIVRIPIYLKQAIREEEQAKPAAKKAPEQHKEKAQKEEVTRQEPVTPLKPLVSNALFSASGYISDSVPSVGKVDGSPSGKTLFGNYDTVFLKTDYPAKVGDKFIIITALRLERPFATRDDGYIIEPVGVVEVTQVEGQDTEARIVEAFGPIRSEDRLDTYHEMKAPLTTGEFRKPDMDGKVIAAQDLQLLNALYDIVYLDKGSKDGVETGDMFRTVDIRDGHRIPTGIIQVISTKESTSTAVIRENLMEAVSAGNLFTQLK
jgi:LysM domain